MTNFISTIQETIVDFTAYIRRIRYAVIGLAAYVFLIHFHMLNSTVPGIDTEHLISDSESLYSSWLGIGRQGLWIVKRLSGNITFNPYFAVILTLLFLVPVCLLVPFIFNLTSGNKKGYRGEAILAFTFGAIFVSHPIMTEQLYFTLQSAEIVFSFFLLELSLIAAHYWSTTRNLLWLLPTILLLQIPFSTYQAFVPLFIAGAVGMTLLQSLFTSQSVRKQLEYVGRFIIAFLTGFIINQMVSRFFINSSYLNNQFYWATAGFIGGCREIITHIRDVFAGLGTFYFIEFLFLSLILIIILLRRWSAIQRTGVTAWQIFLLAAWLASPFYLSILLGIRPVVRAQLVLPFAAGGTAFLSGYLFIMWKQEHFGEMLRKLIGIVLLLLCFSTVYKEAAVTSKLYYTDSIRKQGDLNLAQSLQKDIQAFCGDADYDGAVVFWGRREAVRNDSCIQGDIMGQSFFNWDVDVEPLYFFSSNRIVDFMNTLGSSYSKPTTRQVDLVSGVIADMPCYPAPGSITWVEDTLVVKLSEK